MSRDQNNKAAPGFFPRSFYVLPPSIQLSRVRDGNLDVAYLACTHMEVHRKKEARFGDIILTSHLACVFGVILLLHNLFVETLKALLLPIENMINEKSFICIVSYHRSHLLSCLQTNHGHLFLQGEDRLYLGTEDSVAAWSQNHCQANSPNLPAMGNKQWQIVPIPHNYLAQNWPIRVCSDLLYILISNFMLN